MSEGVGRFLALTGLPSSGKTTLANQLAASLPACRMCPDDWMMASGIDLWNEATRARIEAFQADLPLELPRAGQNVVIEWGLWARSLCPLLCRVGLAQRVRRARHYRVCARRNPAMRFPPIRVTIRGRIDHAERLQ